MPLVCCVLFLTCAGVVLFQQSGQRSAEENINDADWWHSHSEAARWEAVQQAAHKGHWFHWLDVMAREHGDKEFMVFVMNTIHADTDIDSPEYGSIGRAFPYITNQNAGRSAREWLDWWKQNQHKTQEQWIQEGFAAQDLTVSVEQPESVLSVLGAEDSEIPAYIRMNAFRLLRGADFNPVEFLLSRDAKTVDSKAEEGLRRYMKLLAPSTPIPAQKVGAAPE